MDSGNDGTEVLMESSALSLTATNGVVELILTRPEVKNFFDAQLHVDFVEALDRLKVSPALALIIGSTGKVFSGGGNFDMMHRTIEDRDFREEHLALGRRLLYGLLDLPMPVIAAVQGPAIGVGASIILSSDCVVASKNVVIADPHVQIGLVAGDGGCLVWPEAMGMLRARRYLLTGDRISAADAWQFGLVTDLVEQPEDVLPAARLIATRIAELPPLGVRGTKRALANVTRLRAGEVADLALSYEKQTTESEDFAEAVSALETGRKPTFNAR